MNMSRLFTWSFEQDQLMEESADEAQRREDLLKMYATTQQALKIIGEVNMNTQSTNLPPPVDNDDLIKPFSNG